MEVVPVIDLKDGVVVRARLGERASYRPIETPLSPTSKPLDVVAGILSVHPFRTLYIADLDAIEGRGDSAAILDRIAAAFPGLALWVDNGCSDLAASQDFLTRFSAARLGLTSPLRGGRSSRDAKQVANFGRGVASPLARASLVLGSESQRDGELLAALRGDPRIILSLDFLGDRFLGPDEILARAELWPRRVILMTLAKVGSGAGPDLDRYDAIKKRAGDRAIYLAGGLRDARDLTAVKASGAAGILVASALHDGRINAANLMSV